jgi:hypothetical protein
LELLTEREFFRAKLLEECLEMQRFIECNPFPSMDTCILQDHLNNASARSVECYGSDPDY